MQKRLLSILPILSMVLMFFPGRAFAEETKITINAPDAVTCRQDCEFTVTAPKGVNCTEFGYEFPMMGSGDYLTLKNGVLRGAVHAEWYDTNEDSFLLKVHGTTRDGKPITETKTIALKHNDKTVTTKATTSKNGSLVKKCSVCGRVRSANINYPKTIRLSTTSYTYNGKVKKPDVKVVDAKGHIISSSHYTVSYGSGRKSVGRYKVTVTFKKSSNKYTGSMNTYFNIKPKGTDISRVSGAEKAFAVKWKMQSLKMTAATITGYQIRYSTSSKMTNASIKTVKGYKHTSNKITQLSDNQNYYVQVRTYKKVSGKDYYSSWSKAKKVKTK